MAFDFSDITSGVVGLLVFLFGLIQLLELYKIISLGITSFVSTNWFTLLLPYIIAVLGLYLAIEAFIEITNSNVLGVLSFIIGVAIMISGILSAFKILPFPPLIYHIIFIVEGIFLIIAMFAMRL
jgi:hypothetical protein